MNTKRHIEPTREEEILPWYAAGKLSPDEAAAVEKALAQDPELRAHLTRIEEEREVVVQANEAIDAPSRRMADRLFAAIEAEAGPARRMQGAGGWLARIGDFLGSLAPANLGLAGAAAVAVIVLQAGLLGTVWMARSGDGTGSTYETASGPGEAVTGAFVLVAFQPGASVEQITELLGEIDARIVDGPQAGGLYRLRIGDASLDEGQRSAVETRLRERRDVVRMVAPAR